MELEEFIYFITGKHISVKILQKNAHKFATESLFIFRSTKWAEEGHAVSVHTLALALATLAIVRSLYCRINYFCDGCTKVEVQACSSSQGDK